LLARNCLIYSDTEGFEALESEAASAQAALCQGQVAIDELKQQLDYTTVDESDIGQVQVGQAATITAPEKGGILLFGG
jgi:hypothetical protein